MCGNLNVRIGPGTSQEILISLPSGTLVERITRGVNISWDKVLLENGMIGYINQNYLEKVEDREEVYHPVVDININAREYNLKRR